jgi:hypothetical protein
VVTSDLLTKLYKVVLKSQRNGNVHVGVCGLLGLYTDGGAAIKIIQPRI